MSPDEWENLDEVDVMARWPADQRGLVTSTAWKERKEALESLLELVEQNPRLATSSTTIYGEIMDELKKILMKDSNIYVVSVAVRLVGGLARGLRSKFSQFALMVWNPLLEKAKEKKAAVREHLLPTLEAVAASTTLDRISSLLVEHLQKPNVEVKTLLDTLVYRIFLSAPTASSIMPFLKEVMPHLVKHTSDGDAKVREEGCVAVGGAKRLLGTAISSFLGPLAQDDGKMAKVDAACAKAKEDYAAIQQAKGANGVTTSERTEEGGEEANGSGNDDVGVEGAAEEIDPWTLIDPVDVVAGLQKSFHEGLESAKWSERKDSLDELQKTLKEKKRCIPTPEGAALISKLAKVVEKDANVVVGALAAECLALFALALRDGFAPSAPKVMAACMEKFKEKKAAMKDRLVECVDAVATTAPLGAYTEEVIGGLGKANPLCRVQTALFISRLLLQHNSSTLPRDSVKTIVPVLVKLTSDPDKDCRGASFAALGALVRCVGEAPTAQWTGPELKADKMKWDQIVENAENMVKEKGPTTATAAIVRLHGGSAKAPTPVKIVVEPKKAPVSVKKTTSVPPRPAVRPSTTTAAPSTARAAPVRVAPSSSSSLSNGRPSSAARPTPTTRTPLTSKPATPARPPRPSANGSLPGSGRSSLHASHNNLAGVVPSLDGAQFISLGGKPARIAENRSSTVLDLNRLVASSCSPPLQALFKAEKADHQLMLVDFFQQQSSEVVAAHSDLICRWLALRLSSPSVFPGVLARALPLAPSLLSTVDLSDRELAIVMPALFGRIGDSKEAARSDAKAAVLAFAEGIGAARLFPFLAESLKAKSFRQRLDSIDILNLMISRDSSALSTGPVGVIRKIVSNLLVCAVDKDALVRTGALNCVVVVEGQLRGQEPYLTPFNQLGPKEKEAISTRIAKAANGTQAVPRPLGILPRPTVTPRDNGPTSFTGLPRPGTTGIPRPTGKRTSMGGESRLPRPPSAIPAPSRAPL